LVARPKQNLLSAEPGGHCTDTAKPNAKRCVSSPPRSRITRRYHDQHTQTPQFTQASPCARDQEGNFLPPGLLPGIERMPRVVVEKVAEAYLKQHDQYKHIAEEKIRYLERDLDCVSQQAPGVTRGRALHALRQSGMDVVDAVMGLREGLY